MSFHIDEKYNAKLLPKSTSLQEHTGVYPVVVRGVLHSSSKKSVNPYLS